MPAMDEFGLRYGKSRRKGRWDKAEAEDEALERSELRKYKKEKKEKTEEEEEVKKDLEALDMEITLLRWAEDVARAAEQQGQPGYEEVMANYGYEPTGKVSDAARLNACGGISRLHKLV